MAPSARLYPLWRVVAGKAEGGLSCHFSTLAGEDDDVSCAWVCHYIPGSISEKGKIGDAHHPQYR